VGGFAELTLRLRARDGRHVWVESLVQTIFDDDGKFVHTMSSSRDVSERKRTEDEVQRILATLRGVTEGTSDAIFARRVDGTYDFVNRAAADLLGRGTGLFVDGDAASEPDLVGHLLGLDDPAAYSATGTVQFERQLSLDGAVRTFAVRVTPRRNLDGVVTGIVAIASDVTDLVKFDVSTRHREKMEAVEQLAGGIAHDFNNLLTVISGYGDLLEQNTPVDSSNLGFVQEIRSAARVAAALTQRLLNFSRKQITRLGTLDINATISSLHPFLRSMVGESITLDLSLSDAVPVVVADQSQIEQAIINLVLNAKEAMPDGGAVRIVTAFIPAPARGQGPSGRPVEHGEVRVEVSDTGCGIDPSIVDRIFEPFFTTKTPGKGIGLGLSTVHEIVERAGGTVHVGTAVGRGSTFTIHLPRADLQLDPSERALPRRRSTPVGTDAVLVVDEADGARQSA
jgi:PAS domain S-box-containing protein